MDPAKIHDYAKQLLSPAGEPPHPIGNRMRFAWNDGPVQLLITESKNTGNAELYFCECLVNEYLKHIREFTYFDNVLEENLPDLKIRKIGTDKFAGFVRNVLHNTLAHKILEHAEIQEVYLLYDDGYEYWWLLKTKDRFMCVFYSADS